MGFANFDWTQIDGIKDLEGNYTEAGLKLKRYNNFWKGLAITSTALLGAAVVAVGVSVFREVRRRRANAGMMIAV